VGLNLPSFVKRSSSALLGIDLRASSVKVVELVPGQKASMRLQRYAIEPIERGAVTDGNIERPELVAEALGRAMRRMSTRTRDVAMAMPSSAVITKRIALPAGLPEEDYELQVESEASQYIPFAIEEVNLDFQILGPSAADPDEVEVLLAASRKEKVEDRVAVAEAAGLRAVVVDVESYAAQAAFELVERQLPDGGRDTNIVLVDVGANVMNVIILRNDQPVYSREQAFGGYQLTQDIMRNYGMSPEEAEAAKRTNTLPENYESDLLRPFMDNLALEVSRALQFFFTSTQYNRVDHIVLAGGCAVIPGLDEVVANRSQVETRIANPFVDMQLSPAVTAKRLSQDAPSLLVACGLALRRFDA